MIQSETSCPGRISKVRFSPSEQTQSGLFGEFSQDSGGASSVSQKYINQRPGELIRSNSAGTTIGKIIQGD